MSDRSITRINPPFATGGGGYRFEYNIQALFMLTLLHKGLCPIINEPIKKLLFQAKHNGFAMDDFVVFTDRNGVPGKLLCQIKRSISFSEKDQTSQEVIAAAWADFNRDDFDKNRDKLVLATAQISINKLKALRELNEFAKASVDEIDFLERISIPGFLSNSTRREKELIVKIIANRNKGALPTDYDLWLFCRALVVMLFDLDYEESINRTLAVELIKAHSNYDAASVWSRLVDKAMIYDSTAATVEYDTIDEDLKQYFKSESIILAPIPFVDVVGEIYPLLALIGSWRDDNIYDRAIIEKLSGTKYEVFSQKVRNIHSQNPKCLTVNNGVWRVLHREGLFIQSAKAISDDIIGLFFECAKNIFIQNNKQVGIEKPFFIPMTGPFDNSMEMRAGFSEGLCIIKYKIEELTTCNKNKIKEGCFSVIRDLLFECSWKRWVSLKDCLQIIAEVSPEAFLQTLEHNLVTEPQELLALFPTQGATLFDNKNYISELLWALEILAWSPNYLISAIRCLGLLEDLRYEKTNWGNTPVNSIVSILLPWYPQTLSSVDKREHALKTLEIDKPEVYWKVLIRLFPDQTSTTTENQKPHFIESVPEKREVLRKDMILEYHNIMREAVIFSQADGDRLTELGPLISYMDEETVELFFGYLANVEVSLDKEKNFNIWLKLCDWIEGKDSRRQANIIKNEGLINKTLLRFAPQDIRYLYRKLYLGNNRRENEDYYSYYESIENQKREAVRNIYQEYGSQDVEKFGMAVKNVYDVGFKMGQEASLEDISQILKDYHDGVIREAFFSSCLKSFCLINGPEALLNTDITNYDEQFIAEVLSMNPFSGRMLSVIENLFTVDRLYWEKASFAYSYKGEDAYALPIILKKAQENKRYIVAVNVIGRSDFSGIISVDEISKLLKNAGTEQSLGNEELDAYAVQELISWLQKHNSISLEDLSNLEFIYLPFLDNESGVLPSSLNELLSKDPHYFCSMVELCFKKHTEKNFTFEINKGVRERLFKVLFQFKIVPGMDKEGHFNESTFTAWMETVKDWSVKNDRYVVTMHTVGSGLSYSNPKGKSLPPEAIIKELDKAENEELRRGYLIGMRNQRGVYTVDPEGKPEMELSKRFMDLACQVEKKGYSRYAELLKELSDEYKQEAIENRIMSEPISKNLAT